MNIPKHDCPGIYENFLRVKYDKKGEPSVIAPDGTPIHGLMLVRVTSEVGDYNKIFLKALVIVEDEKSGL